MNLETLLERTYTLQNIIPSDHGGMAFISVDYKVKLSGSQNWGEWMGNFEGIGSGGGIVNFDVQRNSIQEFRAEYQTEAVIILKKGNQAFMQQPFKLFVSASIIIKN